MNPDQLLLKRLESNAYEIATKYALYSNNAPRQQNTPVKHIMHSDFMEPDAEEQDARQSVESEKRRDNADESTLNDSSMLMTSTISFIKENIEKQQDPSSDEILSYINKLIKSRVSPVRETKREEPQFTAYSQQRQRLLIENRYDDEQQEDEQQDAAQQEDYDSQDDVNAPEDEYDDSLPSETESDEENENQQQQYATVRRTPLAQPPQLEEEEIILAPPPKLNQSASPQNFVRNTTAVGPAARFTGAQEQRTPPRSQNIATSTPSPHHFSSSSKSIFHSPTGSGTVKSSTSIIRSVLNSSSQLDHPPFLQQQQDDVRSTGQPEGFHSYPSSTTAEDLPSEIQIPKPQTERAEEKIIYYLKYLTNKSQIVRFDAVKSLNEIYRRILNGAPSLDHHPSHYSKQFSASDDLNVLKLYTSTIVDELILCLEAYQHQEEAFNVLVVQTLALMGERAQAAVSVLIKMLKDPSLYALYESILKTLFNIGAVGLEALIEAASNAASEWDSFILTHVANHPAVQEQVIVPALIRESQAGDMGRRLSLIRALASLGERASSKSTSILLNVLISGALNRREVATTIRYFGRQGEQMLTYLMSQNHNPRIRSCAAYAFGAAVSFKPFLRVIINADFATVFTSMPRLTAVNFDHDISTLPVPVQQVRNKKPYLLFDARELITCVRRQLNEQVYDDISSQDYNVDSSLTEFLLRVLEETKAESREEHEHSLAHNLSASANGTDDTSLDMLRNSLLSRNFASEYHPTTTATQQQQNEEAHNAQYRTESPDKATIRALGEAMFDSEESVRAAAAHSIGAIGMPYVHPVIGTLCAGIKDTSAKVRAQSVAAIGCLAGGFKKIIHNRSSSLNNSNLSQSDEILSVLIPMTRRIIPLLRDSFYNVRFQTVLAIREYGAEIYELEDALIKSVVKELTRVLRDGTVNRTEVAQTLVAVGDNGIHQLMDILHHETHHNSKIRMSAAIGLASTPVENTSTIDAVVETLFQAANDRVPLVRRAVLHTLGVLSRRAKETLTYLRAQSLLPFMYSFLKDQEKCVREMAAEVLAQAGPRGELLLVEGVLKDSNATIRCSAGYGLMHVGPKCVRTLLLALNDKDPHVTRAVASALEQIGAPAIVNSLKNRDAQVQMSVLSSVRDVLLIIQLIPNSAALNRMLHRIKEQLEEYLGAASDTAEEDDEDMRYEVRF